MTSTETVEAPAVEAPKVNEFDKLVQDVTEAYEAQKSEPGAAARNIYFKRIVENIDVLKESAKVLSAARDAEAEAEKLFQESDDPEVVKIREASDKRMDAIAQLKDKIDEFQKIYDDLIEQGVTLVRGNLRQAGGDTEEAAATYTEFRKATLAMVSTFKVETSLPTASNMVTGKKVGTHSKNDGEKQWRPTLSLITVDGKELKAKSLAAAAAESDLGTREAWAHQLETVAGGRDLEVGHTYTLHFNHNGIDHEVKATVGKKIGGFNKKVDDSDAA